MDIDTIYIKTGEFGRYQKKAFSCYILIAVFLGFQMLQNIYAGLLPDKDGVTCSGELSMSGCDEACPSDDRNYNQSFSSIATEWDMVCEDNLRVKVDSTQSVFMFGVMIGSFFMGSLSDRFGRFPIFFGTHILLSLFALASSFVSTWPQYAGLRFCTGFFLSGANIVGFVLYSESVGPSKRAMIPTMGGLAFALGICFLSLLAYNIQNWRHLSVVTSIYGVILIPLLYCWIEESPQWHLSKGNMKQCKAVLTKITRMNGYDLGEMDIKREPSSEGMSAFSFVKSRKLLKLLLIQIFSWFSTSIIYFGLTLAAGKLKGIVYVTVAMNSLTEVPANIFYTFLMNSPRLGRVQTYVWSMLISSMCCASVMFVHESHTIMIGVLACLGKFFICGALAVADVQAVEIFPTPIRNIGIGFVCVANRLGGVLAPQFVRLEDVYHNAHFIVFGTMGCISGLLCWLLPETVGKPLPHTIDHVGKVKPKKCCRSDRQKLLESDGNNEDDVIQF